jgi:hypothetical protein
MAREAAITPQAMSQRDATLPDRLSQTLFGVIPPPLRQLIFANAAPDVVFPDDLETIRQEGSQEVSVETARMVGWWAKVAENWWPVGKRSDGEPTMMNRHLVRPVAAADIGWHELTSHIRLAPDHQEEAALATALPDLRRLDREAVQRGTGTGRRTRRALSHR